MLYKYTDDHAIPDVIGAKHDLPQDIVNWIKIEAQPKPFEFRDDLKAGWDVCNESMFGQPDIGNTSPSSGLNYLELGLPYKVPYEKM